MNTPTESPKLPQDDSPSVVKAGRRRFIHGVGIAVPVILTVRSPSVLATGGGGGQCFAPSASASIALLHSRPDRQQLFCSGRTPGFWVNAWKTHPRKWAVSGGEGLLFSAVFGSGFEGKTLKDVMGLNGVDDPMQLGAHLSAAYLNWKMGWVPGLPPNEVLSLQDLKDMWTGRLGSYSPTASVYWGGQQIVAYLQTTMTV